jgi:predicted glutamine amidotransferase
MKKVKVNRFLISSINEELCKTDDDGFGYAILSEDGKIGGERTLKPEKFIPLENTETKRTYSLPIVTKVKNTFGTIDRKNPKSMIAHGRWSTNTVNLENTHPFVNDTTALIHNGVVQNSGTTKLDLKTDCDTEILLRFWEQGGMVDVEKNVSGYYAMAVLETNGKLHIVKDSRADLHYTYSRSIDSFIFATTATIIENICKKMKWKFEEIEKVDDNIHAVFNGNEMVIYESIKPIGSTYSYMSDREKRALGYSTGSSKSSSNYYGSDGYWDNWGESEGYGNYGSRHNRKHYYDRSKTKKDEEKKNEENGEVIDMTKRGGGSSDNLPANLGPEQEPVPVYKESYDKSDYEALLDDAYLKDLENDEDVKDLVDELNERHRRA